MIKLIARLAVIVAAFLSLNVFSHDNTAWIAPRLENTEVFIHVHSVQRFTDINAAAFDFCEKHIAALNSSECLSASTEPATTQNYFNVIYSYKYKSCGSCPYTTTNDVNHANAVRLLVELVGRCDNYDFPNGEDVDADGKIDHCHSTACDINGEMFENPGLTSVACVANGDGEYCEYFPASHTNVDTGLVLSLMTPTGESCSIGDSHNQEDIWEPLPDDELPDPNDPNTPPTPDGNPDCTSMGGGFNVCAADPNEVCDSNGVCPSGCGTVNNNFVCIVDSDGEVSDPESPPNDNSDNQQPDDPNTPGDEGTQSRLDGLLQNTDGIEGLLREIKNGIGKIPGGGGKESEEEEEEDPCPDGQFRIGEACVGFDKNDRPENDDLDFSDIDLEIAQVKQDLDSLINSINISLKNKFDVNLTGGSYTPNTQTIKGVSIDFGIGRLSELFGFSLWGALIFFACSIKAVLIMAGR